MQLIGGMGHHIKSVIISQGVTAVSNPKAPFKRSAYFSTPLSERVDDEGPPLFNCDEWDNFDFSISNYNYKKNRDGRF